MFSIIKRLSGEINKANQPLRRLGIPERVLNLLWITDEDPSKTMPLNNPGVSLTADFSSGSPKINVDTHEGGFFDEPSLIWLKLPLKPNSDLIIKPFYYPSYVDLNPEQRFQYLSWLKDITQPTNLSYVFLYYYGLERHLLIGQYEEAVDEIITLVKYHNKGSFKDYATAALIVASAIKKRIDIIERAPFILNNLSEEGLTIRMLAKVPLTAKEIMTLASRVGFRNQRYIKLYHYLFEKTLDKILKEMKQLDGVDLFGKFNRKDFHQRSSIAFANYSIPEKYRAFNVPDIFKDEKFKFAVWSLLKKTHDRLKLEKKSSR